MNRSEHAHEGGKSRRRNPPCDKPPFLGKARDFKNTRAELKQRDRRSENDENQKTLRQERLGSEVYDLIKPPVEPCVPPIVKVVVARRLKLYAAPGLWTFPISSQRLAPPV